MRLFKMTFKYWLKSDFIIGNKKSLISICLGTLDFSMGIIDLINCKLICILFLLLSITLFYISWQDYISSDEFYNLTIQLLKNAGIFYEDDIQEQLYNIDKVRKKTKHD